MRKRLLFPAFIFLFAACAVFFHSSPSWSKDKGGFVDGMSGGYTGPGPALVTVQQALGMRDDTRVTMQGNIVQRLDHDTYVFRDATGSIHVDIDDDRWGGQSIGPEDTVEIYGKVDKDWNSVEIDVKRVMKK